MQSSNTCMCVKTSRKTVQKSACFQVFIWVVQHKNKIMNITNADWTRALKMPRFCTILGAAPPSQAH